MERTKAFHPIVFSSGTPFPSCFFHSNARPLAQGAVMNSMMVISPYKTQGVWAFDDESKGLSREPFVDKANSFIDAITSNIANAEAGFRLLFSGKPFPGFSLSFKRVREECEGNWYACDQLGGEGWLCPALFKYFDAAPEQIFVKAEALP
jgi:hypothetical protein